MCKNGLKLQKDNFPIDLPQPIIETDPFDPVGKDKVFVCEGLCFFYYYYYF